MRTPSCEWRDYPTYQRLSNSAWASVTREPIANHDVSNATNRSAVVVSPRARNGAKRSEHALGGPAGAQRSEHPRPHTRRNPRGQQETANGNCRDASSASKAQHPIPQPLQHPSATSVIAGIRIDLIDAVGNALPHLCDHGSRGSMRAKSSSPRLVSS